MSNHTLTPVQLEVALHYYYSPELHPQYDESMAFAEAHIVLVDHGLIQCINKAPGHVEYRGTTRLAAYIEHILQRPLPVQKWVIEQ